MSDASSPSLFTTLRPDLAADPNLFKEGDCGIIIRPDGSFRIITSGVDAERLRAWQKSGANLDDLSDEERAQLETGQKLLAISVALSSDPVMDVLLRLTADPEILDPQKLAHVSNPH